jgi:multiple sugar transport system substrate-binding protein
MSENTAIAARGEDQRVPEGIGAARSPLNHRTKKFARRIGYALLVAGIVAVWIAGAGDRERTDPPPGREEVVFWHFWGGADREVVEQVVRRFNEHQDRYYVRAIAMPGSNLDLKLFLAVTGGDPPDVINQDDPIMADWAARGALKPLSDVASAEEIERLRGWLLPAAVKLGQYDGRMFAVCNGLDVRALYYNETLLAEHGLAAPQTLAELDQIAETIAPANSTTPHERFGYLPDPRRLWAWGTVFGGDFYEEASGQVTVTDPKIVAALAWMATYRERYGAGQVAAYRLGDQSLPGQTFPLLARRYAVVMDGQWRVRDIRRWQQARQAAGQPYDQFGVAPLPPPPGGRPDAGWVNGNFFLLPRGADQSQGAWEFMKFWIGFDEHGQQAVATSIAGGWIPVSRQVIEQAEFQSYLSEEPLFAEFVRLAASPNQIPTPITPGAPQFYREVVNAAETTLYAPTAVDQQQSLAWTEERIEAHLRRIGQTPAQK